jgi:hypothetical protein
LGGRQLLEVAWSAQTAEGANGAGRVAIEAPTGTSTDTLMAAAEAAFAGAVDAKGAEASAEAIQAEMKERLGALLPENQTLTTLEVTSFESFVLVAGAVKSETVAKDAGSGRKPVALVLLGLSLFCLASGGLCLLGGVLKSEEAALIKTAKIVSPEDAGAASGLICLEAVVAQIDSAIVAPVAPPSSGDVASVQTGIACLFLRETVTRTTHKPVGTPRNGEQRTRDSKKTKVINHFVSRFLVGELLIQPTERTEFLGLAPLPSRSERDVHTKYLALAATTKITLVGRVNNGIMMEATGPTNRIFVSSAPTRDALAADLKQASRMGYQFGFPAIAFGCIVLVFSLIGFRR